MLYVKKFSTAQTAILSFKTSLLFTANMLCYNKNEWQKKATMSDGATTKMLLGDSRRDWLTVNNNIRHIFVSVCSPVARPPYIYIYIDRQSIFSYVFSLFETLRHMLGSAISRYLLVNPVKPEKKANFFLLFLGRELYDESKLKISI